jgi:hypothetical protein
MGFVAGKCFGKIGANSFTQMLGLSHIQQFITDIKIFVDAGLRGNGLDNMLKF